MALSTQLQAVNTMLGYIGEAPVNSISNTAELPVSAANAVSILDETSKEVQSNGWHFNTEREVTLSPSAADGTITLAADILQVDHEGTEDIDLVQRGTSLYDRKEKTDTFTKDIKVTVVKELPWDSLPEQARRYITLRATRYLQSRIVGSRELEALILRDEFAAKANLETSDNRNADRTIFDNYDTYTRVGINRTTSLF
ncbi:MAG: phage tail protein [Flavobacteriaceae bacterium]|jgi:hypothetical protein|nr:phage tail protein [Flavobacteriaceae bacterium]